MKQIQLNSLTSNLKFALIDDEDLEKVSKLNWHIYDNRKGYVRAWVGTSRKDRRYIYMHHLIMNTTEMLDHIDGNTFNNQKSNLRFSDDTLNNANSRKRQNTSSIYKGVSFCKLTGLYRTKIKIEGLEYDLGRFYSQEDAARAYNIKARELFGEFARLNFNG